MADSMSIDKKEPDREGSDDSMGSTPEAEAGLPQDHQDHPDHVGQPKRKGGRKPIYATSEERKQRNRQAQAAFRERRTEYIKQLEETIRVHETNLHNLQTAHRSAADECLMLRYKNSLLERILLEKGIDVQAELRAKTGSPQVGPTHMPQNMAQPPTMQRAIMNRHHQARRSNSNIAPKLEPGVQLQSPQLRPTPSSVSSPTSNSPGFSNPGVMTPPASETQAQHQRLQGAKGIPANPALITNPGAFGNPLGPKGLAGNTSSSGGVTPVVAAHYPSPFQNYRNQNFRNHMDQLEQEYESQADMVEDQDTAESGPGPYPETFPNLQQQTSSQALNPNSQQVAGLPISGTSQSFSSVAQLLDPYDPMLDMDPFGLSASMQFPTQFSFDTSSMR